MKRKQHLGVSPHPRVWGFASGNIYKAQLTRISDVKQSTTKPQPKKEKAEEKVEKKAEENTAQKETSERPNKKKKSFEGLLNPGDTSKRPKQFFKDRGNMGEEVGVDNNVGENQR